LDYFEIFKYIMNKHELYLHSEFDHKLEF